MLLRLPGGEIVAGQKTSFVIRHEIRKPLERLTMEERGQLFTAMLEYSEKGIEQNFDGALGMAFDFIRCTIDQDKKSWEKKSAIRAEAGSKGGKQTAANRANAAFAFHGTANAANQAVPVPVPESVPGSFADTAHKCARGKEGYDLPYLKPWRPEDDQPAP